MATSILAGALTGLLLMPGQPVRQDQKLVKQDQKLVKVARIYDGSGQTRGRTSPRPKRPPTPSRGIQGLRASFFYDNKNVRDDAGRIITGLGFLAWQDSDSIRIAVYLLLPGPGAPNAYLSGRDKQHLLQARSFLDFALKVGEERRLEELRRFGLEPWTIKALLEPF